MYALDNMRDPVSAVAVRSGNFIYHGRTDTHTARRRNNRICSRPHSEAITQGHGQINVTVENSTGTAVLANVKIDVHTGSPTGTIVDTATSDANDVHVFQETFGSDYYFTFTDLTTPARFTSPQNWPTKVTPLLTATVTVTATLL